MKMNSLEWINEQIEECKKTIICLNIRIIEDSKYPSLVKTHNERIEDITQLKQRFEQIKTELEAWEVCKTDNSILYVLQTLAKGESIDWHRLPEEKQIKLKKALEVNEDAISK